MPSVNEFVKRINASDKFLRSIAALPTYKDIEALQYKKLDEFLSTCKWNEEEVANAVTAMGMVERFSESSKKKSRLNWPVFAVRHSNLKLERGHLLQVKTTVVCIDLFQPHCGRSLLMKMCCNEHIAFASTEHVLDCASQQS